MRLSAGIILSIVMAFLSSCKPEKATYISVVFDVEDYITPEEEGIDDIPFWLAETMNEVGVTGTFFVIGEKARSLEKRGRQDVIQAMAKHDIGSHTNLGSIHPTVTEILETATWEEGVRTMNENESAGFSELERIFGVPVKTLARHGGSYGPQLVASLGSMQKGYVYSPVHLPKKNAVWFCNTLNFHGEYGSFDNSYYRDDLFAPVFDSLKARFSKDIEGMDVVSFFACHPCKIRSEQFWDFNFYEGANPPEDSFKVPDLRPAESMLTARKNFRRLMMFLKEQEDQGHIKITTYSDLMDIYGIQKEFISKNDLREIAVRILATQSIVIDDFFSPAEVFSALARSISEYEIKKRLPRKLARISPLGPMEMPPVQTTISGLTLAQVIELAAKANNKIEKDGHLPAQLSIGPGQIGTGSLLALFSKVYLDILTGEIQESYDPISFAAYPVENEESIISEVEGCKYWIVHRTDLDMSQLVEFTRLQLWTLKPAWDEVL